MFKLFFKTANLLLILLVLLATSCSVHSTISQQRIPEELPPPLSLSQNIRVALVLGEGGSRGMAHLGVLKELENANIPIDLIVGCSIESFVGALYADSPDATELAKKFSDIKTSKLLSFNPFSTRRGIWRDKSLERFLTQNLTSTRFDQLKIPLIITTTDLLKGETVFLRGGEIVPTICASCAIPFFFQPKELYGRVLVDGMLTDPIPIQIAKDQNPLVIIAVDLSGLLNETSPKNLFQITKRSYDILKIQHNQNSTHGADIVIKPKIDSNITFLNTKHSNQLYEAGRQATRNVIEEIRDKLEEASYDSED